MTIYLDDEPTPERVCDVCGKVRKCWGFLKCPGNVKLMYSKAGYICSKCLIAEEI
jgi:hypothetical protein